MHHLPVICIWIHHFRKMKEDEREIKICMIDHSFFFGAPQCIIMWNEMQDEFLSSTIFFYCCEIFFSKSNSSLEKHELCNLMSGTSNRSSHFLQFINLFVIKIQEKNPRFWYFYFFTLISTITCASFIQAQSFSLISSINSLICLTYSTHKRKGKNYQDAFVCHYSFRNWYSNPVWLNNNKMNGNIEWSRYIQRWKKRIGNFFFTHINRVELCKRSWNIFSVRFYNISGFFSFSEWIVLEIHQDFL